METPVQIVVTPGSGDGRALGLARHLRRGLQAHGYAASLLAFREMSQLRQWTRTCDATFSYLVAVGGDATLSEAAAAAVRHSTPFVPVPSGFGNLFTSVFEHPREPDDVIELLGRSDLVWADLGAARNRMFLSHESFGFLARVQQTVERIRRRPRQHYLRLLTYYRTAAKRLRQTPLDSIQVEIDGELVVDRAALVTIANVETYRGFLSLTPAASPLDGFFDVCVVPRTTRTRVLGHLVKMMLEIPGCREGVGLYRGRRVRVRVNRGNPHDIRMVVGALPLVVPLGSVERLEARRTDAESKTSVITLLPSERDALVHASGRARALRDRSTRPVEVA
jgi:diacylglycerol kinase family enzyme